MDDREKLLFDHDLANYLTNLKGATYLLRGYLGQCDERTLEALGILTGNIAGIEKTLRWYSHTNEIAKEKVEVAPWEASELKRSIASVIAGAKGSLPPPEFRAGKGIMLGIPQEDLSIGLVGAGNTLGAAAEKPVKWSIFDEGGAICAMYQVSGEEQDIDPQRLFRKYYWPVKEPLKGIADAGLPYLEALLTRHGGSIELVWRGGVWTLWATAPHWVDTAHMQRPS